MPSWISWEHALLAANTLAMVGSAWTALLATRRADRWQAVAQGAVRTRNSDMAKTQVAPAWHAPRFKRDTPGQRLQSVVQRRKP